MPATHPAVYVATLDLTIGNDAGVLGRICTLIGEKKANISDLEFVDRKPDFYRLLIDVELRDVEHLHSLMLALEAESDVAAVEPLPGQSQTGGRRCELTSRTGRKERYPLVFKRRDRRTVCVRRSGDLLYPRGGWKRAFHYVKHRVRRLAGFARTDRARDLGRGLHHLHTVLRAAFLDRR